MLYAVSLQKTANLLKEFGRTAEAEKYQTIALDVLGKIEKFWDEEKGAYVHSFKNGRSDGKVLRYANMFAILYDLCDEDRQKRITENVLKSDKVQQITTPYILCPYPKTATTSSRDIWRAKVLRVISSPFPNRPQ